MLITPNTFTPSGPSSKRGNKIIEGNVNQQKNILAKNLFGKEIPVSQNISFGWSNYLSDVEKNILDLLTNPANKQVLVTSHSYPDGDSYGSSIGIAGILKSFGKQVQMVVDYRPKKTFQNCPSPIAGQTVTDFVKEPKNLNGLKKIDLAVITDTAEPFMLNFDKSAKKNRMLQMIIDKKPKNIIIIDHHPDEPDEKPNKQKWLDELSRYGYSAKNVLYWREKRASAAEMVSELDQEVVKESQRKKLNGYNPDAYHGYRLTVATGIITDAGGTNTTRGKILDTKFARLSYQHKAPDIIPPVSATRYDFEWLVKNSGIPVEEIDSSELIARKPIDQAVVEKLHNVVYNRDTMEGIKVKRPSKGDPLGYLSIENWKGIEKLSAESNLPTSLIYKIFKSELVESLYNDMNAGLLVLANKTRDNVTYLTFRSYGYDYTMGELHKEGHVFGDSLALKSCNYIEKYHGSGGGHKNACGFKSNVNVDFDTQLLPLIQEVVNRYKKENPELDKVPTGKLERINRVAFNGNIKYNY